MTISSRRLILISISILLCLLLTSCGSDSQISVSESAPEPTQEPTPAPTPTMVPMVEFLGETVSLDELKNGYSFELYGQQVNTRDTTELHFTEVDIGESGLETFRQVLPYMVNLTYLTIDRCGMTDEECAALREEFPDANIAWRVFFKPFSCMTDVEKIWASCDLRDEVTEPLKYCNKVKYLDIGHNAIHDLWFLEYMPDLEVLILSCGEIEDLTQLKYCKNLIFLEVAGTYVRDVSPIAQLETLEYLNVGQNANMDPQSFKTLYTLPNLKRFFIGNYPCYEIDLQAEEKIVQELMPDCEVNFHEYDAASTLNVLWRYNSGPYSGGYNEMYQWIRDIFEYDNPCGSTRLYDEYGNQIWYTPPERCSASDSTSDSLE